MTSLIGYEIIFIHEQDGTKFTKVQFLSMQLQESFDVIKRFKESREIYASNRQG